MNMPFVETTLIEGHTEEKKLALIKALTGAVETSLGVPRESIRVVSREVPPEHWVVGGMPKG